MKKRGCKATLRSLLLLTFVFWVTGLATAVYAEPGKPPDVPVKGMVTMVDLGANSCVPCKMMAPILEKLEKDYDGKAAIVFIDVWKDPSQGKNVWHSDDSHSNLLRQGRQGSSSPRRIHE